MKKRLIAAALLIGLATGANAQVGEKPHHEPLVAVKPPKPNIMMVLDTSASMTIKDMKSPKGYNSSLFENSIMNTIHYDPEISISGSFWNQIKVEKYSRLAVMQFVVLQLLEKYRYQAYIGIAPLDYDGTTNVGRLKKPGDYASHESFWTGKSYEKLFFPPSDLSIDNNFNNIKKRLLEFPFDQNTPLNSPLYRTSVIMRGEHPNFESPVRYRCQQQHIILMTDGEQNDPAIMDSREVQVKVTDRWGRYITKVQWRESPILPRDKRRGLKIEGYESWNNRGPKIGDKTATLQNVGTVFSKIDMMQETKHKSKVDEAGIEWLEGGSNREPIPIVAHGVRFSSGAKAEDVNLQELADITGGVAVGADDTQELERGFHKIFQSIISSRSGTGSYEDQIGRTEDSIRYASYYDPFNWTGKIVARGLKNDNTQAQGQFSEELWTTDDTIKPNQGVFYTYLNGIQETLDSESSKKVMTVDDIKWFKGDTLNLDTEYRPKEVPLGDIIDSHIQYHAKDKININLSILDKNLATSFEQYLLGKNRSKTLYNYLIAGSNDGLLNVIHATKNNFNLDANKHSKKAGERAFTYLPGFFANKEYISKFTRDPYTHSYGVNGTTHLFDALVDNKFRSLAVTTMGAGYKGLVGYQLYERDNRNLNASESADFKINFEITNNTPNFRDLGYTYSGIEFLNRQVGNKTQALAIFGNGYTYDQSGGGKSVLYIADAVTGAHVKTIELPGGKGGASTPAVVVKKDPFSDYQIIERIYVGDQSGKLYRIVFDTSSRESVRDLKIASTIVLFDVNEPEAGVYNSEILPITVQPILTVDKRYNKYWIYFGTGRAVLKSDADSVANHYFYGIKDNTRTVSKSELVTQHTVERVKDKGGVLQENTDFLEVSDYQATLTSNGWRYRIVEPKTDSKGNQINNTGERVILPAAFYRENGQVKAVVFTTYGVILDEKLRNDPCSTGGHFGQTLFLSPFTGGSSKVITGQKEGADGAIEEGAFSGIFSQGSAIGLPTGPGILTGNSFSGNQYHDYRPELVKQLQKDNPQSSHTDQADNLGCYLTYTGIDGKDGLIPVGCKYEPVRPNERIYLHKVI